MWTVYRKSTNNHISIVAHIFTGENDTKAFVKYLEEQEQYENEYSYSFSYVG